MLRDSGERERPASGRGLRDGCYGGTEGIGLLMFWWSKWVVVLRLKVDASICRAFHRTLHALDVVRLRCTYT